MTLSLRPYFDADFEKWDSFCNNHSYQATFLHTRKYISYHKDKFKDLSLVLELDKNYVGLFPAAENPSNKFEVISHPGLSYGGLLFGNKLRGNMMLEALRLISEYYFTQGYKLLIYKAVPDFYHRISAEDDCHALRLLGAKLIRTDLTTLIDLYSRPQTSTLRRRSLKKASQYGIEISQSPAYLPNLWEVIHSNLKKTHNTVPVHTFAEIKLLIDKFPSNIAYISGIYKGSVVAGMILFQTDKATHTQYVGANDFGKKISALDLLIEYAIEKSKISKRWFDFGISTEDNGRYINESLQKYKVSFGGGNKIHFFYQLDLVVP